jgi:hypothetical protein
MNPRKDWRAIVVVASLVVLIAGMMTVVVASAGSSSNLIVTSSNSTTSSSLALTSSNSTTSETTVMSFSIPPTNGSQTCGQKMAHVTALLSLPTPQQNASMLAVAENSSQYATFVQDIGTAPSLADGGPVMEFSTNPDCSELYVTAFTYCLAAKSADGTFPQGEPELCISVSPAMMTVNGCMVQPTVDFGGGGGGEGTPQMPTIANCTG